MRCILVPGFGTACSRASRIIATVLFLCRHQLWCSTTLPRQRAVFLRGNADRADMPRSVHIWWSQWHDYILFQRLLQLRTHQSLCPVHQWHLGPWISASKFHQLLSSCLDQWSCIHWHGMCLHKHQQFTRTCCSSRIHNMLRRLLSKPIRPRCFNTWQQLRFNRLLCLHINRQCWCQQCIW